MCTLNPITYTVFMKTSRVIQCSRIFPLIVVLMLQVFGGSISAEAATKKYSTIQDLQKAFIKAGGDCKKGKLRGFRHAESGISCPDGYTNLLKFKDRATAVRWAQASSALCNNMTSCSGGTLVGDNWAIVTQAPEIFKVALGGTILK